LRGTGLSAGSRPARRAGGRRLLEGVLDLLPGLLEVALGLLERAAGLGGTAQAGPVADQWRVAVRLPLPGAGAGAA